MKTGYDDFFKKARPKSGSSVSSQARPSVASPKDSVQLRRHLAANSLVKRKKSRRRFAWSTVVVCVLGFAATGWAFVYSDQIERFLQRVEVSWLSSASAAGEESNSAAPAPRAPSAVNPKPAELTDINHLSKLSERSKNLDAREEEIARQEAELAKLKTELQTRLSELTDARGKISEMLADRVKSDEQKIDTLVQLYSNMKPIQAAKIFETMDKDLAIEILPKMKKKNAADIMNLIKPEKAQIFSEKYAGYNRK